MYEYLQLFQQFRDLKSLEEVKQTHHFSAHALRFINAITEILECLDAENILSNVLEKLAQSHQKHKVTIEHFKVTLAIAQQVISPLLSSESSRNSLKMVLDEATPIISAAISA
ncbi:unnamed protein product [Protopolystoma xenopodis]|uniref:Globin domain-containing protein n=1 Tax=Protopolystoma xenopodis TaxID=117903 RepID=A0A448WCB0_9PLAT|nr:unnamed protein product [Protopolystoma xenopodis]